MESRSFVLVFTTAVNEVGPAGQFLQSIIAEEVIIIMITITFSLFPYSHCLLFGPGPINKRLSDARRQRLSRSSNN